MIISISSIFLLLQKMLYLSSLFWLHVQLYFKDTSLEVELLGQRMYFKIV